MRILNNPFFKLLGIVLLTVMVSIPIVSAEDTNELDNTGSRQSFTHTVFVEDFTAVWCTYCPSASETLKSIFNSQDLDFYFVCMITQDENGDTLIDDAEARAGEYNVGAYPDVIFDGGYEEEMGDQQSEDNYRAAIESSGTRTVPDLNIDLQANYVPDQKVDIKITVENTGTETYTGNLRVHITEIVSRYLDYDGNNYPYGFLDYAINTDISINADGFFETETTWDSLTATDGQGNPLGIDDPDNIFVIASVFNSQPNPKTRTPPYLPYVAHYADQSVGTILQPSTGDKTPPHIKITQPQDNNHVKGTVEIKAEASDDSGIDKVTYWINSQTPVQMTQSGSSNEYTALWDSTSVSDGTVTLNVEARDLSSNIASDSITITVSNSGGSDTTPPSISILNPTNNEKLSGTVTVRALVTDDWGVASVEYQVDDGTLYPMTLSTAKDTYEGFWDTTVISDGYHTLKINADDTSGNSDSDSVYVLIDNSGSPPQVDTEPPVLVVIHPEENDLLQGTEDFYVTAYDNTEVSKVECAFVIGELAWKGFTKVGTNDWQLEIDSSNYPDGNYDIIFRAVDSSGNIGTETNTVEIRNEFYDSAKPTLKIKSPRNGDTISDSVNIVIEADDDYGIDYVEYRIDEEDWLLMINSRNNVYQGSLDTEDYKNGKHTLTIRAFDLANNEKSITLELEISNSDATIDKGSGLPGFSLIEGALAILSASVMIGILRKRIKAD